MLLTLFVLPTQRSLWPPRDDGAGNRREGAASKERCGPAGL